MIRVWLHLLVLHSPAWVMVGCADGSAAMWSRKGLGGELWEVSLLLPSLTMAGSHGRPAALQT